MPRFVIVFPGRGVQDYATPRGRLYLWWRSSLISLSNPPHAAPLFRLTVSHTMRLTIQDTRPHLDAARRDSIIHCVDTWS
jgi:hypothetical protein